MTDLFTKSKRAVRITASDIRAAMSKRWADPEWAIMWEVGEGTGTLRGRSADAVMMSLWPSRGLELHGVEIKISRSDWKREAADPTKAEAIARYCDRWWIHTAPGVVDDLSDLPPAWGLREFDGKSWATIREAEKTGVEAVSRPFLAAMLRRADRTMRGMVIEASREGRAEIEAEREKIRQQYAGMVEEAVKRKTGELSEVRKNMAAFEAAFGISPDEWGDYGKIGVAARSLAECGKSGWAPLADRLRKAADEIDAIEALSSANGGA